MKRFVSISRCGSRVALVLALSAPLFAQSEPSQPVWDYQPPQYDFVLKAAGLPDVSSNAAYTQETGFLSLPGRIRFLTYEKLGEWLTMEDAARAVADSLILEAAER